jgi:hypothetical protein
MFKDWELIIRTKARAQGPAYRVSGDLVLEALHFATNS